MDFELKYDIFAEAKAVLNIRSPLDTFKPEDIGSFVLAWSGKDASTSVRGTLMSFGCDNQGPYAIVKGWASGLEARYTLVTPLPASMLPTETHEIKSAIWRDPKVKQPEMPL